MIYSVDNLIKDYHTQVKDKFPEISFEQFEKICKAPFYYIKKKMEDVNFPLIHIKFLGKFLVYSGKVKSLLNTFEKANEKGMMSPVDYENSTRALKNYLKNETINKNN